MSVSLPIPVVSDFLNVRSLCPLLWMDDVALTVQFTHWWSGFGFGFSSANYGTQVACQLFSP